MAEPTLQVPINDAVDLVKWAIGVLAAAAHGWNYRLHKRLGAMDTKIDDAAKTAAHAKANRTQIELAAEQRFALKSDLKELRDHLDGRLDRLSDQLTGLAERRREPRD